LADLQADYRALRVEAARYAEIEKALNAQFDPQEHLWLN
jgi:hypothetical protein